MGRLLVGRKLRRRSKLLKTFFQSSRIKGVVSNQTLSITEQAEDNAGLGMSGFWSGATDAGREGKWGWQDSMTPVGD